MKIQFSNSAVEDLSEIKEYYLSEGVPQVGTELVQAIVEHVETLSIHPDIGRVVPEFDDPAVRELVHTPFRIVYLREDESIKVIRVWRSERLLRISK